MIRMSQIKKGDYFIANNHGDLKIGEVVGLNVYNNQVCIDEGITEYWYDIDQLTPIMLSEKELYKLKFTRINNIDGTIKYSKGAFRILIPKEGDFSRMKIWYRDEYRIFFEPVTVDQLQNHFFEMTKVHLNDEVF